jgi:hypothetical protein
MITIQIGEMPDKVRQWAACGEHSVVKIKGDAALSLARKLIVAGYPPGDPLEIRRGEEVCLIFPTLAAAASLVVVDADNGRSRPHFGKFKANVFAAGDEAD